MQAEKKYYRQLDSLRAFAVAGVTWHHWMPDYNGFFPFFSGVELFFVLSGFLITGILLNAKRQANEYNGSLKNILKSFYFRRFLRIFPLYYAVLIWATALNISNLRSTWPWHYFYFSNFYLIHVGHLDEEITHFWTLAVEEQFYLVWPFVILLISNRSLLYVLWFVFAVGPIYRLIGGLFFSTIEWWDIGTLGNLDSLGIGALLAYYKHNSSNIPTWLNLNKVKYTAVLVLVIGIILISTTSILNVSLERFLYFAFLSLIYVILINACIEGVRGLTGRVLNFSPLVYLGSISYGIYVLHNFAHYPAYFMLDHLTFMNQIPGKILILKLFSTLSLAILSWHFFEKPFNQLKRYFPYYQEAHNHLPLRIGDET